MAGGGSLLGGLVEVEKLRVELDLDLDLDFIGGERGGVGVGEESAPPPCTPASQPPLTIKHPGVLRAWRGHS